ncbi:MAG: hypothetical protein ABEJ69_03660 [Candidatus Nanohaloarchaea archaeon]
MELHLKKKDYGFLGGGLVVALALSLASGSLIADPMVVESYTRFLVSAVVLASVFFIYRAIDAWAGELARYLEIIGAGFLLVVFTWIPHIGWHVDQMPAMLGLSPSFWLSFFHGLDLLGFLLVAYGFYLFWKQA